MADKANGAAEPAAEKEAPAAAAEQLQAPLPEYPAFPDDPDLPKVDSNFIFDTFLNSSGDSKEKAKPAEPGKGVDAPSSDPATTAQGGAGELPSSSPTPSSPTPAGVPPTQVPGQPAATPPSPVVTAPAGGAQDALRLQSLEATVAALQQQNAFLLQQAQSRGAPQAEAQPPTQPGVGELPTQPQPYNLALPQDAMAALFNQDGDLGQATSALQHIVNHALGIVKFDVLRETQGLISQALQGYGQQYQAQTERQRMQAEYYAKYKEHNNPLFHQLVAAEATAMWSELPNLPWSEQAMNALGARVNKKLQELGFNPTTIAVPPTEQQGLNADAPVQAGPGAKPPAMTGGGTRAGGGKGAAENFISATLS